MSAGLLDCASAAGVDCAAAERSIQQSVLFVVFFFSGGLQGVTAQAPLSVSSSPPALKRPLPAPVYSALLSKPYLYKPTLRMITAPPPFKKKSQVAVMFFGLFGVAERSTNWGSVGCLGCSWSLWPRDVTVSTLWLILFDLIVL